jgi:protein-L-isoaspartate(D-aspartate) O-methyltransferase
MAYADHPLPIGYGATISQPYIVAFMTELLAPNRTQRVLEIGTGSGYQAAILAQLAAKVYTIEIVPELARAAAKTLRELGYSNVMVRQGDGYKGWPEEAPFDGIIVTARRRKFPRR